jgi:hypothetical protein
VARVKLLWRPHHMRVCAGLGRDEFCHPLLTAVHHLRVEVVDFLLKAGLNPKQRGTVHPYTGDCMTVAELQGAWRARADLALVVAKTTTRNTHAIPDTPPPRRVAGRGVVLSPCSRLCVCVCGLQ